MKNATTPEGVPVVAGPFAPELAQCPHCGGVVLLRSRQQMGSRTRTYFWQHERGTGSTCRPRRQLRTSVVIIGR